MTDVFFFFCSPISFTHPRCSSLLPYSRAKIRRSRGDFDHGEQRGGGGVVTATFASAVVRDFSLDNEQSYLI